MTPSATHSFKRSYFRSTLTKPQSYAKHPRTPIIGLILLNLLNEWVNEGVVFDLMTLLWGAFRTKTREGNRQSITLSPPGLKILTRPLFGIFVFSDNVLLNRASNQIKKCAKNDYWHVLLLSQLFGADIFF